MVYGERLTKLRKEQRWTLDDFSENFGINRSTYAGYERENRQPPIEFLVKISDFYNVSVDYILGISNDREPKKVNENVKEYLKKTDLKYDGKPVNEQFLKPIREMFEFLALNTIPNEINQENQNNDIQNNINNQNQNPNFNNMHFQNMPCCFYAKKVSDR